MTRDRARAQFLRLSLAQSPGHAGNIEDVGVDPSTGSSSDDASSSGPPSTTRKRLGELLVDGSLITREQLHEALEAPRDAGKKLGQVLVERGWLTESQLAQALSRQLSVPWVALQHVDFSRQLLGRVPRTVAESHCLIPVFVRHVKGQGETLYIAMDDPTNDEVLSTIATLTKLPTRPMIAATTDIRNAIRTFYGGEAAPPSSLESASATSPNATKPATAAPALRDQPDEEPSTKRTRKRGSTEPPTDKKVEKKGGTTGFSLTLLDGTTIALPSARRGKAGTPKHASDDATATRSSEPSPADKPARTSSRPEDVVDALVSLLVRKGLLSETELTDELKKKRGAR